MPGPTTAQVIDAYVKNLLMSRPRATWKTAKEAAAKKGLDVKTFDAGLGPLFDATRDVCKNVAEMLKMFGLKDGALDPKWEQSIKKHTDGLAAKVADYKTEMDRKAAKHPEQKGDWDRLKGALDQAHGQADREPRVVRRMVANMQAGKPIGEGVNYQDA
jgi:hypothetical protein